MPLQDQNIPVSFGGGLDTKTDPKQVIPGKFLTLENAVFSSPGRLTRRGGHASVAALTGAKCLAVRKNELVAFDGARVKTLAGDGAFYDKGPCELASFSLQHIFGSGRAIQSVDAVVHEASGLICYVWNERNNVAAVGPYYAVLSLTTGTFVVTPKPLLTLVGGRLFRVYAFNQAFYVMSCTGTIPNAKLQYCEIPVATPAVPGVAVDIMTVHYDAPFTNVEKWDACVIKRGAGDRLVVVGDGSGSELLASVYAPSGATMALETGPTQIVATAVYGMALAEYNDTIILTYTQVNAGNDIVVCRQMGVDLTTTQGPTTIATVAGGTIIIKSMGICPRSDGTFRVYFTVFVGGSDERYEYQADVRQVSVTVGTWTVGSVTVFAGASVLAARPYAIGSAYYIPIARESYLQPTFLILTDSKVVVAKILTSTAAGCPGVLDTLAGHMIPARNLPSTTVIGSKCYLGIGQRTEVAQNLYCNNVNVLGCVVDHSAVFYQAIEQVAGIYSPGVLSFFDGQIFAEHGFHFYPENVTCTADSGATYVYQYCIVYKWRDVEGRVHYSAPSVPIVSKRAAAISIGATVTVTIPCLRVTRKIETPIEILVFRTVNNGATFYDIKGTAVYNDSTVVSVTKTDSCTDAVLTAHDQLYTEGGVLENIAPPQLTHLVSHRNRVFGISSEDSTRVPYSKLIQANMPVEFNDAQELIVDPSGGGCTAQASLDDKLVLFKERGIYFVTGLGPDAMGSQNDFSDPLPLPSDVGCSEPKSLARIPTGVIFKSAKGFYLLDRSLNVTYVGAAVEAFNARTVTATLVTPSTNQVRFYLDEAGGGGALVYDYLVDQWSQFKGISAAAATIYNGEVVHAGSGNKVLAERGSVYTDDGTNIVMKAVTSWLNLAGIGGFQRARALIITGEFGANHSLTVSVEVDHDSTTLQSFTFASAAPARVYRLKLNRQKCTAMRITLSGYSAGEFNISGITLEAGVKKGLFKVPAAQTGGPA